MELKVVIQLSLIYMMNRKKIYLNQTTLYNKFNIKLLPF